MRFNVTSAPAAAAALRTWATRTVAVTWQCMAVAAAGAAPLAPVTVATKPAPPPSGLSVVLDASESMCGYFSQGDTNHTIQALVRRGAVLTDQDAGNRFYILKQTNKKVSDATRDVVAAPRTIQADAQNISEAPNKRAQACAPFNGVGSDVDLIFDARSPTRSAHSMVLITDAQLAEGDRERFLNGFTAWAMASKQAGETPSAGFAVAQVPFNGRYFPVSDPDPKRREGGYVMAEHERPLFIFWFARSDKYLNEIKSFIDTVATADLQSSGKAGIQHLLPVLASGTRPFTRPFSPRLGLKELIDNKPTITVVTSSKERNKATIADCIRTFVSAQDITVQASRPCGDDKQLFDGVSEIDLHVKPAASDTLKIDISRAAEDSAPDVLWRITPKSIAHANSFQLTSTMIEGGSNVVSLHGWSVDSDFCKPLPAGTKPDPDSDPCLEKLRGRAFQADVLADQFVNRQKRVVADTLVPLNAVSYPLLFKWKSR